MTDAVSSGCAGPTVGSPSRSKGTVSSTRAGDWTTGTWSTVPPGPVAMVTRGSTAKVGTLSGSEVVNRSTSRWPSRRSCAMAKPGGCISISWPGITGFGVATPTRSSGLMANWLIRRRSPSGLSS